MIHFLRSNILKKISSKISCARATQKYPFNIRLNSDDPMIRVIRVLRGFIQSVLRGFIQSALRGLFRV